MAPSKARLAALAGAGAALLYVCHRYRRALAAAAREAAAAEADACSEPTRYGSKHEQRKARRAAKRAGAKGQTADAACGDAEMASSLQQRDPHGVGLPSASGRDLLRRLLAWEPTERIMASEALEHPFLQPSEEH